MGHHWHHVKQILEHVHIIRAHVHFQCLEDLSIGRHATQMSKAQEERREGRPIPSCNFSFTDILTCIMHAACARACRLSPLRRREGGWKKDIKFQSSPLVENFVSQRRAARCRRTETYPQRDKDDFEFERNAEQVQAYVLPKEDGGISKIYINSRMFYHLELSPCKCVGTGNGNARVPMPWRE